MANRTRKWIVLPLIGGLSFWLPDSVMHLIRNVRFDRRDVWITTTLMLFSLSVAWIFTSKFLGRNLRFVAPHLLLGIWITGGLMMSLGWVSSTPHPLKSVALSSVLGILPMYTFMAAAYDGSLLALLLSSVVLFVTWIVPMSVDKGGGKPVKRDAAPPCASTAQPSAENNP